jgi:hypothetical protein
LLATDMREIGTAFVDAAQLPADRHLPPLPGSAK